MKNFSSRRAVHLGLCLGLVFCFGAPRAGAQEPSAKEKKAQPKDKKTEAKTDEKKSPEAKDPAEESTEPAPLSESLKGLARAEYEAGKILYADGDYRGARLKFRKSYQLSQDARLWWNIAATEKNLRNYSKVIDALNKYNKEGGELITPQDRADANRLIATVSAFVATVRLNVKPSGAEITVDGKFVGKSPLKGSLKLNQGDRVISVSKPGFLDHQETRQLGGGETVQISVELKPKLTKGTLRVVAGVGDIISIDGRVVRKSHWQGELDAGVHTLTVTAPGKRPYQSDVVVQVGQTTTSRISLELKDKPKDDSFWGGPWPWVVGGAVLAAGAGVGAYFALRPQEEEPPPIIDGTLGSADAPLLRFR